jgi:hypothetical protein
MVGVLADTVPGEVSFTVLLIGAFVLTNSDIHAWIVSFFMTYDII